MSVQDQNNAFKIHSIPLFICVTCLEDSCLHEVVWQNQQPPYGFKIIGCSKEELIAIIKKHKIILDFSALREHLGLEDNYELLDKLRFGCCI